jgi:hypothetical protein
MTSFVAISAFFRHSLGTLRREVALNPGDQSIRGENMKPNPILAIAVYALGGSALPASADVIDDWTAQADAFAFEKRLNPPAQTRLLALMHVSMFEAVNAIDRRYLPYALDLVADVKTSREVAVAAAGYSVLTAAYPDQTAACDILLASSLAAIPAGSARDRGVILGRRAAADLLEKRVPDGSEIKETWRPVTAPGVYLPTAPVASATIGQFRPWVMQSAAQFRPAPPPALTSQTWTRDVNEIRALGGSASVARSAEQTDVARFWFLNGPPTWHPLVQQVLDASSLDLTDRARVHALVSMAAMDAFIAVFEAKFHYNFWRPVTAIRNADITGNRATAREPGWLPLGETPMHPEYPCAHCISSSAVATVLLGTVGDIKGTITLTSTAAPGVTRRFTTLAGYVEEVSNARVWAGFHYRFSTEVGRDMGRKIGELTVTTQLRPR